MKTATVRARVGIDLKEDVDRVLACLGLTISDAINLFMAQIRLCRGIPFDLRIPNDETLQTFKDTDKGRNLVHNENADEMFNKLGIKEINKHAKSNVHKEFRERH